MMRFVLIVSVCCWLFCLVIQTALVVSYRYDYTAINAKYNRDDIPLWRQKACEKAQRMKSSSHYVCDELGNVRCLSGWQGDLCQVPMCSRGCDPMNGYCERPGECRCRLGFTGELCQKCIALPGCQHGDCTKPFECICRPGWKGLFCTEPTCRPGCHTGRGYCETPGECRCRLGWSGRNCSECAVMPGCQFGTCSKPLECKCLPGYTGLLCSTPTCAVNCHKQHGYCRRPNECRCRMGWTGENCAKCFPYPGCVNGNCEKPWECNCLPGWGGILCNEKLSYCLENPNVCANNGTCIPFIKSEGSYRCECKLGYFGRNCEHIDEFLLTSVAPPRITPPSLPSTTPTWLLSLNGSTSAVKRNDGDPINATVTHENGDDDDDGNDVHAGDEEEDEDEEEEEEEEEDADGDEEEDADTDEDNVYNRDDESDNVASERWSNSSKPIIGKLNTTTGLIDKTTTATTANGNGNTLVTAIATSFNSTNTTIITAVSKKASAMAIPLDSSGLTEMANITMNHISGKDNYKSRYSLASPSKANRTTTTTTRPTIIVTPLMPDHIFEMKTTSKTTTTTIRTSTENDTNPEPIKDEQQHQNHINISEPILYSKGTHIIQAQGDFVKATVTPITIKMNSSSVDNRHQFLNHLGNSNDNNTKNIIDQLNYQTTRPSTMGMIVNNRQTNILGQKEVPLMESLAIQKIPLKGSQDIESESKLLEIPLDDFNFKQQKKLLKEKKVGENQIQTGDNDDNDNSGSDDDDDDEDDEDYDDDIDSDINYYLYDDDDEDDDNDDIN